MPSTRIEHYSVNHGITASGSLHKISLFDSAGVFGGLAAVLIFSESITEASLHWPGSDESDTHIEMRWPMNAYEKLVDLLRNEKPILLVTNRARNTATLTTIFESVGEEES